MLCHKELRRAFLQFNRKFFDSKIALDIDVMFAPVDGHHAFIEDKDGEVILQIDSKLAMDAKLWKMSLLHEMAHTSSGDWKHGKRFYAEIDRLYSRGAYKGLL